MNTTQRTEWKRIPGTLDYINELGWKAKYQNSFGGYASYKVYTDKKKVYSVGGLPETIKLDWIRK